MNSGKLNLIGAIVTAVLLLSPAGAQAVIRYVALDGSGANGQSWGTAYRTIQAAINDSAMTAGGEIRVKEGTYGVETPIMVTKAVRIYGGYSGVGETRNWTEYRTIIDGMNKAAHCLWVTANATIDGIGIMYGYGSGPEPFGGGVAVFKAAATITNCVFKYNWSEDSGGALATHQATGTRIANCTFQQNTANYAGGAIYNEGGTGLQIIDCIFLANAAYESAGAIVNVSCGVTISGCVFQGNGASIKEVGLAGAILNDKAHATITDCVFAGNNAAYGGGISNLSSNAVIDSCWFTESNSATLSGGGIFNHGGAPTITNCLFNDNVVKYDGAAIADHGSTGRTINCVFWGNSAGYDGGAIFIGKSLDEGKVGNPQFVNCTIYGNTANSRGGGVCSEDTPSGIINSIVWGNSSIGTGPGIHSYAGTSSGKPSVRYSNIQGTSLFPGTGNKRADPRFIDPNAGDFRLAFDSPGLDAGSNAAVLGIATDFAGGRRLVDGDGDGTAIVDMGALELQEAYVHLTRGQIIRSTAYDNPTDATPTYTFLLRLETDDVVTSVDFQAPGGSTVYRIPGDSHTSAGNVETFHRVQGRVHTWEYWAQAANSSGLAAYGDGTYRILANYRDGTQAETRVAYLVPGTANPLPQPTQRPQVKSPAYATTVPSPVQLTWNACTDSAANSIYLSFINSSTKEEAAGAILAKTATTSSEYRLVEGTYDVDVGFANMYEAASTDGTPFQFGKTVLVGHRLAVPYTAVFRFWSPATGVHFYTTSVGEKDKLITKYANAWAFEGTAYYACSAQSDARLRPVYRFWSGQSHFYTIKEAERKNIIDNYSNVWTPEGIAFYAYPEGDEPLECRAVYRFWHRANGSHFYTMSEGEANKLITQFAHVYAYEGVAFYAYPKK